MAGSYFTLATVKLYLDINHNDDDSLLNALGAVANQETDNVFFPYAETIPFTGGAITDTIKYITDAWVCGKYKLIMKELDAHKAWMSNRDKEIATQIDVFMKSETTRTKWVADNTDYRSEPLLSDDE